MARPSEIDPAFAELKPDWKLINRLIQQEQKEYIRQRLKAIRW